MAHTTDTTLEGSRRSATGAAGLAAIRAAILGLPQALRAAFEIEAEERRLFLWLPVAVGAGVVLYFAADREPLLWLCAVLAAAFGIVAALVRSHRRAFIASVGIAAVFAGMASAGWRTARLAAPVLDRIRMVSVEGYVEELDVRPQGARFILRMLATDGLDVDKTPFRIRLTTRRAPDFDAGAYVEMKARLLPPSRAAEPGGYDFARDAWYSRIGAVGSVLGRVEAADPPEPPDLQLRVGMAIDRARNALARRVDTIVGGDAGAIAAAMVTGKRDLLSDDTKDMIREAGIFHVMTLYSVNKRALTGGMDQDTKPRAYSYIRFSDRSQVSGDSQRRQLDRAVIFAAKMGLRLDESTTIRDLGISAFHGDHKRSGALGVFLAAVCAGKIKSGSYLLIESMDRLSREDVASALSTFMQLINAGIVIVTLIDEVTHSRETIKTQWSTLIYSISMMAQASEESLKKSDRLAAAWAEKRAKLLSGVIATSSCPGWLKRDGSRFIVLEDRAKVVKSIFEDLVGGLGRQTIARRLNEAGIRPFGHGVSWHGGSVQKVTENAAVIGRYQPHSSSKAPVGEKTGQRKTNGRVPMGPPIENYYPPIITAELFLRARRVSQSRSIQPGNLGGRRGTAYSNLFTSVCVCGACRKPVIFQHQGPRSLPKLRCSGNRNGLCDNDWRYAYSDLERQVLDWIDELQISDTRSEKLLTLSDEASRLALTRETKAAKVKVLIDAFSSESSRFAAERVLELEQEIGALDLQISALHDEIQAVSLNPSASQRKAALKEWRQAAVGLKGAELYSTRAKIAQSFRSIVRHMIFFRDGAVHVVLADGAKHYVFYLPDLACPSDYTVRVLQPKNGALILSAVEEQQLTGAIAAVRSRGKQ